MKQKSGPDKVPAEQVLKDIRRQTRRQYSAEEKIRIVLEGLRGEAMCGRFDALMAIDQAPMSAQDRIQMRWDSAYVVELSRRAIERLFAAAGAHGLYEGNAVYRAFRDINTACHHAVIDFDTVSNLMGQFRLTGDLGENPRAAPFA